MRERAAGAQTERDDGWSGGRTGAGPRCGGVRRPRVSLLCVLWWRTQAGRLLAVLRTRGAHARHHLHSRAAGVRWAVWYDHGRLPIPVVPWAVLAHVRSVLARGKTRWALRRNRGRA